jgi:hypothetical protein
MVSAEFSGPGYGTATKTAIAKESLLYAFKASPDDKEETDFELLRENKAGNVFPLYKTKTSR